ncbi:hypothetical protein FRC17_007057 [Serendipita sp. 399]|nr:hypothetical protein FRC17_007057 [Serendipita sp. 399]
MSPGVVVDAHYLDDMRDTLPAISTPILRLLAHVTMSFPWEEEWFSQLQFTGAQNHLIWLYMTQICLKDPPFITGRDIWKLRFRLWIHMHSGLTNDFLMAAISDLEQLSNLEHQLQSADIGIADPGDFLLAFIYLNHTYAWDCYKSPKISIVNLLVGDSAEEVGIPRECVKHLSGVCHSINDDPARLIRLLIELIRADISHDPVERRPQTLFELLRHGISHLASKDLRSFVPSCKRLIRYINESYKQFEDAWDDILSREPDDHRFDYRVFNSTVFREELGVAYKEAIALLSSQIDGWSGEQEDVSWPREYLRPTGTKIRPFIENVEEIH